MSDKQHWFSEEQATFGDRLAGAREAAGLTQKTLASKLGVKLETLIDWEDDIKEPRANRVQMVSGILGVSIGWLLTGIGEGPTEPADSAVVPAGVTDILTEIRTLRTQMVQQLDKLAQLEKSLRIALKDG